MAIGRRNAAAWHCQRMDRSVLVPSPLPISMWVTAHSRGATHGGRGPCPFECAKAAQALHWCCRDCRRSTVRRCVRCAVSRAASSAAGRRAGYWRSSTWAAAPPTWQRAAWPSAASSGRCRRWLAATQPEHVEDPAAVCLRLGAQHLHKWTVNVAACALALEGPSAVTMLNGIRPCCCPHSRL